MNLLGPWSANFSVLRVVEIKALQKVAKEFGHEIITPPMLKGRSGISHSFSFLVASEKRFCGVDIYETVSGVDVLKTHIKQLDTEASVCLISTIHPTEETRSLCSAYGMRIFASDLQGRIETKAGGLQAIDELWRKE